MDVGTKATIRLSLGDKEYVAKEFGFNRGAACGRWAGVSAPHDRPEMGDAQHAIIRFIRRWNHEDKLWMWSLDLCHATSVAIPEYGLSAPIEHVRKS